MSQLVQPPKGTKDFLPEEMILRRKVIETIRECFALYGFVEIDSPVFEYFELLSRKCGSEVEREIYVFEDKAKRKLGLRFEFTSPLGRYYATNAEKLTKPFKRYIIGKVYRYENTQAGRYREFFQADADIIGSYSMKVESELIDLAVFTLEKLGMGNYEIVINNRKILDGIIKAAGIEETRKDAALRALDKTAKIGETGVIKEFQENGISEENYRSFMRIIDLDSGNEITGNAKKLSTLKERLIAELKDESVKQRVVEGIDELNYIIENVCKTADSEIEGAEIIKFDPLLVRGLGYYTGPIFEIKSKDVAIGSFAAGGRYDNLVELYGARPEGSCGISFGVERIIDIIMQKNADILQSVSSPVKIYIVYLTEKEKPFAYKAAKILRSKGISAEICVSSEPSIGKEIKYADKKKIEYVSIIGEREVAEQKLTLKNLKTREERLLSTDDLIEFLH
ncbi:MAG: histidine--tRNA ligase [Candidatus Acidulodesulfobacterium sp.]